MEFRSQPLAASKPKSSSKPKLYSSWLSDEGTFNFGKYVNDSLENVAVDDPEYLRWVIENVENMADDEREVIRVALENRGRLQQRGQRLSGHGREW